MTKKVILVLSIVINLVLAWFLIEGVRDARDELVFEYSEQETIRPDSLRMYLERCVQLHPGGLQGTGNHQARAPGRSAHVLLRDRANDLSAFALRRADRHHHGDLPRDRCRAAENRR